MLSFSKVCFSFEMVKDNSVFLSCIPLDILYFTRHRWCLMEFVYHAAFLKHQIWKAKNTLVSKRGVSAVVCFLSPEERARTLCPQPHIWWCVFLALSSSAEIFISKAVLGAYGQPRCTGRVQVSTWCPLFLFLMLVGQKNRKAASLSHGDLRCHPCPYCELLWLCDVSNWCLQFSCPLSY